MSASRPDPIDKSEKLASFLGVNSDTLKEKLEAGAKKFNLAPTVVDHVVDALIYRHTNKNTAEAAIKGLEGLQGSSVNEDLVQGMKNLQGRFIAMFAAEKIPATSYHFYGHGKEMSQDPGNFVKPMFEGSSVGALMQETANALGAAHDIIQGKGPPINERKSAEIFEKETKQMIDRLILQGNYNDAEVTALNNYRDHAVPFLAEECIVNATYLLFQSGKRDFDNVLKQIHCEFSDTPDLNPQIAAMKMSMALADTRRSEMRAVLQQGELFNSFSEEKKPALKNLLDGIGLSPSADNFEKIEGFLLRVGQNIRMTAELAVAFAKPEDNMEEKRARLQVIRDIRADNPGVEINIEKHLNPFLQAIPGGFGEAAFAKALGVVDQTELKDHAKFYGLTEMVNDKTLDFNGWSEHEKLLLNMKTYIDSLPNDAKQEMANILYFAAAKAPGHRVGQETYDAMIRYQEELTAKMNPMSSESDLKQIKNLTGEIKEIESANRSRLTIKRPLGVENAYGELTKSENIPVEKIKFESSRVAKQVASVNDDESKTAVSEPTRLIK